MVVRQQIKELDDFKDLTSDIVIREAAYPEVEWLENGGNTAMGFLGGSNSYSNVSMQDDPPEIRPYGTNLLGLLAQDNNPEPVKQNSEKRAVNIAEHWKKVQGHPCCKKLVQNPSFKHAWDGFQKKTKQESSLEKYKSEFANFRFYNLIARHICWQMISDEVGYRPTYPDADLFIRAKKHIEKLQADFGSGLKLNSWLAQTQLENHLNQLALEIKQAPRKDRETPTAHKRRCLEGFAVECIKTFGEASPTILNNLAATLGWNNCNFKTMELLVKNAKVKVQLERNKALANALKSPVQKS